MASPSRVSLEKEIVFFSAYFDSTYASTSKSVTINESASSLMPAHISSYIATSSSVIFLTEPT